MSVTIRGNKELMAELERRLGRAAMQRISDRALQRGAEVFVNELKRQFETFRDTGESIKEITVSEPMWIGKVRTIKVYWKGPKDRYRIIHLNEWGTVTNPNPRGKGAIARAMRNCERAYREAIRQAIREGL
ncbi:hypothetical protein [Heyndrickxia camelliae]|uniref:HK97 gp10 family phage protein n=1 Tax=Heyndrickxia camelliae TaxID=1707093 RepID=A0A2N3LD98_9BACI|nr:hypothetical protein [Heyndrickxia camelliae]PKR82566.1 hypothetical protein CWO92_23570 [Heyndrickxia camelliae]